MEIIQSIIGFFIAIGILVTFHEYGHFYIARLFNVRVLNFSIGFGKTIYKKKFNDHDTEYSIGLIPLGGYVKMLESRELNESSSSDTPHPDLKYCFDKQSVYKKFLIVAAGPVFNLILAVIFFTFVHFSGITGMKPIVSSINNSSPTINYDLFKNLEIYKVNDVETKRWQDVRIQVLDKIIDKEELILHLKDDDGRELTVPINIDNETVLNEDGDILTNIGIVPKKLEFPPIIGSIENNTPAHLSGLEPGDIIKKVNDIEIITWSDWTNIIKSNPDNILQLSVIRFNKEYDLILVPASKVINGETLGYAGVSPDRKVLENYRVKVKYSFVNSIHQSILLTYHYSILTFKMIYKLFTGQANVNNISGPFSIAEFTGKSLSMGIVYFAYILAILSISLGVLNLLPIPVLDGGHLVFYLFEMLIGRPVPENIQLIGQQVGIIILFGIMILAFYNDFLRMF